MPPDKEPSPIITRFPKSEKLTSKKLISQLFAGGKPSFYYPLRAVHLYIPKGEDSTQQANLQVLFSVPKKRFPKAHDRNRLKRLMREAYRLNKSQLEDNQPSGFSLLVAFIYIGNEILTYNEIENQLIRLLRKIK